ncbi:NAD(P)-dependent dehydrogenase (short-subunit alcohol dehydrogenase family) [Aliiruegeria haliotis]|uniref:NAD(P)-dependent dehydrogenase (Short-subunit alcohol dehydrogenase family) n=1 Tax=Aliiruegeria haliotis TaxID=1280846 RepID=A0A2T0RFG8_9RHOB|nr:3-ketoacyl-ACP reductase [Aliiruegeria haliotis]PRY19913.1 NAD(P)-dependent dehydrogenase (short-subunit alcohol dehydrogenase family) [Aliiruegeria haliotis]
MKNAFVTGSSRGIGHGIALALADKGFNVAVNGLSESDAMADTCTAIEAKGVRAVKVPGDVSNPENHAALLDRAEDLLGGPLCALVNNAGVGPLRKADILETEADSWDHVMEKNAKAVFFLTQTFANRLLARERSADLPWTITNITSVSAFASSIDKAEYCVSKAAAGMVTKAFAQRLAPEGIQVFDIQPGIIETDLSRPVLETYGKMIEDHGITLVPRFGQPDEVGKAAAAAANGEMPYCVGQAIRPDGGLTLQRL